MSFARKISLFFRKSICNPRNRDYSKRIDKTRCQSGGIGRRAAFRSQWAYAREGSSPFSGTNFGKKNLCRTSTRFFFFALQARVAELADARDLGSRAARRAGSSPASRTRQDIFQARTWNFIFARRSLQGRTCRSRELWRISRCDGSAEGARRFRKGTPNLSGQRKECKSLQTSPFSRADSLQASALFLYQPNPLRKPKRWSNSLPT